MLKTLYNWWTYRESLNALRQTEEAYKNHSPFEVTKHFKGFGEYKKIVPKQVPYEIEALYELVKQRQPQFVCEIGTYRGGTLYLWCQAATPNATIISCDLPGGLDNAYSKNRINFYKHFAREGQILHFIEGDTHTSKIFLKVKEMLPGDMLDFLFIDGDHSYEGVKADFEMYSPLVRQGGVVAFHDILPRDLPEVQVDKLWNEIKHNYRHREIIAKEGEYADFIGIGVLWL